MTTKKGKEEIILAKSNIPLTEEYEIIGRDVIKQATTQAREECIKEIEEWALTDIPVNKQATGYDISTIHLRVLKDRIRRKL